MALDTTVYEPYIKTGLDTATKIVQDKTQTPFSKNADGTYVSTAFNAPVKTGMYDFQSAAPLQKVNAPDYKMTAGNAPQYQGLMGGDYNALQTALSQPGQQKATDAYNQGTLNLANAMGGRGLYGSSIMADQQTKGLDREYMNALAANESNAAAQRYGMQASDLNNANNFVLNLYSQKMQEQKDLNAYNAQDIAGRRGENQFDANLGLQQSDMLNQYNTNKFNYDKQYNEQLNNWTNQQNYEKNFLMPQQEKAWNQAQDEMMMNRSLALAGQGAPLASAAANYASAQDQIAAYRDAANQSSNAALWGAGANLVGTLGSAYMKYKTPTTTTG